MIDTMGTTRIPLFSGAKLLAARTARDWSRGRLSVAVDKSITSIAAWERGEKSPTPEALWKVAKALGVEPGDLLSLPKNEWGLAEYRVVKGWDQKDVAQNPDLIPPIAPSLLSQIESTYLRPSPAQAQGLAELYEISEAEIFASWNRARTRLLPVPVTDEPEAHDA